MHPEFERNIIFQTSFCRVLGNSPANTQVLVAISSLGLQETDRHKDEAVKERQVAGLAVVL